MRVKGYTRVSEDSADVDEYFHGPLADVAAAFAADLDYLVCVMPDTKATRHIVDDTLLRALPPRAVFVNPGRGGVVDEAALAAALQEGRLAGAVLDVFEKEPLPAGSRLLASAERAHHLAHRRVERAGGHRADLHRQLPAPAARRAAAVPRRLRAGVLTCRT